MNDKKCVVCGKMLKPIEQYDRVGEEKCWTCWRDLVEDPKRNDVLSDIVIVNGLITDAQK